MLVRHLFAERDSPRNADRQTDLPEADLGGDHDGHPQRGTSPHRGRGGQYPAGIAEDSLSRPRQGSGAAVSVRLRHGVCAGGAVRPSRGRRAGPLPGAQQVGEPAPAIRRRGRARGHRRAWLSCPYGSGARTRPHGLELCTAHPRRRAEIPHRDRRRTALPEPHRLRRSSRLRRFRSAEAKRPASPCRRPA